MFVNNYILKPTILYAFERVFNPVNLIKFDSLQYRVTNKYRICEQKSVRKLNKHCLKDNSKFKKLGSAPVTLSQ